MSFSTTYSSNAPEWEQSNTLPFNELILSWNGIRPQNGKWTFWVSLGKEVEWLKYAEWGSKGQLSFSSVGKFASSYQDTVTCKELCTSFQVKVEGEELEGLKSLIASVSNLANHTLLPPPPLSSVLFQNLPLQSQMILDHPRHKDLCSPTSTSTAINYLLGAKRIDPAVFADLVHDNGFDIYGNWVLNTAECYNQAQIPCHVARLENFSALHAQIMKGKPVVVSVKGTIPGAAKPYERGHLMCVVGYENGRVYCIDSAFGDSESTLVNYDLNDFLAAWGKRRNLAYIFL